MKTRKAKNDTLRNTLTIELQGCVNSILNMVYAVNFLRLRNKHSGTCNLAQNDAMCFLISETLTFVKNKVMMSTANLKISI